MCDAVVISVNVSVCLEGRLAERLRLRSRAAGDSLSEHSAAGGHHHEQLADRVGYLERRRD